MEKFEPSIGDISQEKLSLKDFNRLSEFIHHGYGIKMPIEKKTMLQCRLQKRLKMLNMSSFTEYCNFLFSKEGKGSELVQMIDVVTTNKTDFFRESAHFDFLYQQILPKIEKWGKLRVWSAGCSSGEEVYSLAMLLSEFSASHRSLEFEILGTDISTRMLEQASNAIYNEEKAAVIPIDYKIKYMLRNKEASKKTVRINKTLRSKVYFQRLNFMDSDYNVPGLFDIVFCRNVLIYFDKSTQELVINRLCKKIKPGGFFFLGHSESIMDMNVPLHQIKPTIFQRL